MSRRRRPVLLNRGLREHPALRAWAEATSGAAEPECILVFRERVAGAVYRLPAVGAGGSDVFAKRSRAAQIAIEQFVYEAILPKLSLSSPRYYGATLNGEYGWIFLEDVGDDRYRQDEPEQCQAAARWLAAMHTGAAGLEAVRSLPDAGPERYFRHLRAGRRRILKALTSGSFQPDEIEILNTVVAYCNALEERWEGVDAACRRVPGTLVHCDFQPKNVLTRRDATGLSLWPIDWEMAGFGVPAADLTRIDLRSWWSSVRPHWPQLGLEEVERLARAGHILQLAAAIDWLSVSLECERPRDRSDAVVDLELSVRRRLEAAREAGAFA